MNTPDQSAPGRPSGPEGAFVPIANLNRRKFLVTTAGAAAFTSVAFTGCAPAERKFLIQSPIQIPEDYLTGFENWYATTCQSCSAGCGQIVRVMDGRALKIEGNPDHPVSQGKNCVRGLSGLQALYHPDRIDGPRKRTGDKASGQFQAIAWDDALFEIQQQLKNAGGKLLVITGPIGGHLAQVVQQLVNAIGGQWIVHEPIERTVQRAAISNVFGQGQLPFFDIARASYVLSFGADWLGTWGSPVLYGRGYGQFRQGAAGTSGGRPRGTMTHFDSRLSMTANAADEWFPVNPGTEGLLALGIAHEIVANNLGDANAAKVLAPNGAGSLNAFAPQQVAQATGVAADVITRIAKDFASKKPAIAIGGGTAEAQTNGSFNLQAIYALNHLVGSVGVDGGVKFNPTSPINGVPSSVPGTKFTSWQNTLRQISSGAFSVVLIHGANPVYASPGALNVRDALAKAPYVASFSPFMDETSQLADLILPDNSELENWGSDIPEPGPGYAVVSYQQPVINPMLNSRSFADVLIAIAQGLGGAARTAIPWNSFQDLLKDGAKALQALNSGSVPRGNSPDEFWNSLLQRGGWWDTSKAGPTAGPAKAALPSAAVNANFAGDPNQFPFNLIVYPSATLDDGRNAHLPFVQHTPDPMTTVAWQTWVEINPTTASQMGIEEGDIVSVQSPNGTVEAPAYVYPGIGPRSVAMPLGQGHTAYTRYAEKRGVNPLAIVAPLTDAETGALAWGATRVQIYKTGRKAPLPKFEGTIKPLLGDVTELYQITNQTK